MGKGYGEGPAADERYEALERGDLVDAVERARERSAVYGATADNSQKHFLGWLGEVDPDELFTSGRAWGLSVIRRSDETPGT